MLRHSTTLEALGIPLGNRRISGQHGDRAAMQPLLDESTYVEQARFPLLCNPCPAGGCH